MQDWPMISRAIPRIDSWKYTQIAYVLLSIAGGINLVLSLLLPTESKTPSTKFTVTLTEITIALVLTGIWIVAMRGAVKLVGYVQRIPDSPDGRGFADIAQSLLWLIGYIVALPLTSSLAEASEGRAHSFALVVLHNYLPLPLMLIAVLYLYRGSRRLLELAEGPSRSRRWRSLVLGMFALVIILFIWHFIRVVPDMVHAKTLPRFVLPLPILLVTYILPHVVAWLVGTLAILNLWEYSTRVQGTIYRRLFRHLYQGLFLVYVGTFVSQLLTASSVTLSRFSVGVVSIYVVLLLGIVGYVLIYRGVEQLIKLEAVG